MQNFVLQTDKVMTVALVTVDYKLNQREQETGNWRQELGNWFPMLGSDSGNILLHFLFTNIKHAQQKGKIPKNKSTCLWEMPSMQENHAKKGSMTKATLASTDINNGLPFEKGLLLAGYEYEQGKHSNHWATGHQGRPKKTTVYIWNSSVFPILYALQIPKT